MSPKLGAERLEFLRNRLDRACGIQPRLRELQQKLLGIDGLELVAPMGRDPDLDEILADGREIPFTQIIHVQMAASQCHSNISRLWATGNRRGDEKSVDAIGTGYALADDQLWRQHTWGMKGESHIVDTNGGFEKYFGIVLRDQRAASFALNHLT